MQKQKISELVLARLKSKREEQIRNRPHYQVLRLEVIFQKQKNQSLKNEIRQLQGYSQGQMALLQSFQNYAQQLDNTGRQNFPRIIIRPQFIASEKVEAKFKQFYRKSSNTYLRSDIQRKRNYEQAMEVQGQFVKTQQNIIDLQKKLSIIVQQDNKNWNKRRLAILKQQIRLRQLIADQQSIKQQISNQEKVNQQAVNQYRSKKAIVENSQIRIAQIQSQINRYRQLIEQKFNPNAYRQYQTKAFSYQIKNQVFLNNLHQMKRQLTAIKKQTSRISTKSRKSAFLYSPMKAVKQKESLKRLKTEQPSKLYTQKSDITTYYSRRLDY